MGGIDIADTSISPLTLEENDRLLLTTDGLYKSLGDGRIAEIMNENNGPAGAADSLMKAVKACTGPIDNTTFAVIG